MRRRTKGSEWRGNIVELLGIGKAAPPKELVRRRMAMVKRNLEARFKEKRGIEQEAAKYWSTIEGPITKVVGGDKQVAQAVDGLRRISEKVANRKLVVPKAAGKVPGILAGSLVGRVPVPYDYGIGYGATAGYGGYTASGSADKSSGQMSVSVQPSVTGGGDFAYAEVGLYLRPLLPMLVRAWASPAFAFYWSANSLSVATPADSAGSTTIGIDCYEGAGFFNPIARNDNTFFFWNVNAKQELIFDFGSSAGSLAQVQAFVDPSQFCILNVNCQVTADGYGWPGGLATASLSVTAPSITFELVLI